MWGLLDWPFEPGNAEGVEAECIDNPGKEKGKN